MEKNNRLKKFVIVILLFIFCFYGFKVIRHAFFVYELSKTEYTRTYVEDFEKYKKDFEILKDFTIENNKKYLQDSFYIDTNKFVLYTPQTNKAIKMDKKATKSLKKVVNMFENQSVTFVMISIKSDRVKFLIEEDSFVVIYSRNGKKPKGFNPNDDGGFHYYVKDLGDNWYSVTGT